MSFIIVNRKGDFPIYVAETPNPQKDGWESCASFKNACQFKSLEEAERFVFEFCIPEDYQVWIFDPKTDNDQQFWNEVVRRLE